jgi:hypothetical protein
MSVSVVFLDAEFKYISRISYHPHFSLQVNKEKKPKYRKQTVFPRSPIPTSDHRCIGKTLAGQAPGMAEHNTQN